jgi:hypothetical protein
VMTKKNIILLTVWSLCGLLIAYLQHIALSQYLYWRLWWFDIPMHLLGGVFIGLGFLYAQRRLWKQSAIHTGRIVFYTLVCVVGVGLLWKLFELTTGMYDPDLFSTSALMYDVLNDVLGGLCGLVWYWLMNGFTNSDEITTV